MFPVIFSFKSLQVWFSEKKRCCNNREPIPAWKEENPSKKSYGNLGSNVQYWWLVVNGPKHAKTIIMILLSSGLLQDLNTSFALPPSSLFPLSFSFFFRLLQTKRSIKWPILGEHLVVSVCMIERGKFYLRLGSPVTTRIRATGPWLLFPVSPVSITNREMKLLKIYLSIWVQRC